jgi:hypothetical protein
MRLVACAAAALAHRRNISHGDVVDAVQKLLRNEVLQGFLPDTANLVIQPLQALRILEANERVLSEILLRQIARHTTLEHPGVLWGTIVHDERLLNLRPAETWNKIRDCLRDANLILQDGRQWFFRYPILGERLRLALEVEIERFETDAAGRYGIEAG